MIANGTLPTSAGPIYTVPSPSPGVAQSGQLQEFNLFRIVNTSATVSRTISIWLNTNGVKRLLTPLNLFLPPGAAWDDVPVFQLRVGDTIEAEADDMGVDWTINRYFVAP